MYRAMVITGAFIHLCYAIALVFDPAVQKITSIAALDSWMPSTSWSISVFYFCTVCSVIGLMFHESERASWIPIAAWCLAVPQAVLMAFSIGGELKAIVSGSYPDGYTPSSRWFIFADQSVYPIIAVIHTWAIVREFLSGVMKCREPG